MFNVKTRDKVNHAVTCDVPDIRSPPGAAAVWVAGLASPALEESEEPISSTNGQNVHAA